MSAKRLPGIPYTDPAEHGWSTDVYAPTITTLSVPRATSDLFRRTLNARQESLDNDAFTTPPARDAVKRRNSIAYGDASRKVREANFLMRASGR